MLERRALPDHSGLTHHLGPLQLEELFELQRGQRRIVLRVRFGALLEALLGVQELH